MSEIVKGFDSRYWNGILPEGYDFEYCGIKISEDDWFVPIEPRVQWAKANAQYGLLRLPFHYWIGPAWWQDPKVDGKQQAKFMRDTIDKHFLGQVGELPPALDLEDPNAVKGHRTIQSVKSCLLKMEELFGEKPIIYTAHWWFDSWITPFYSPEKYGGWDIYSYELWNSDPPPPTPVGEWTLPAEITQVKLNHNLLGFNSKIDTNETTRAWLDSHTVVPPPVTDCQEEIDKAVAECEAKAQVIIGNLDNVIDVQDAQIKELEATITACDQAFTDIIGIIDNAP